MRLRKRAAGIAELRDAVSYFNNSREDWLDPVSPRPWTAEELLAIYRYAVRYGKDEQPEDWDQVELNNAVAEVES